MTLLLLPLAALAAPTSVSATLLAGGRTAPESAILVPAAWEGEFEPTPLVALDTHARVGDEAGPWLAARAGGWGYPGDGDASELDGGLGLGWAGPLDLAGRYDAAWFPALAAASNGRAELLLRARERDGTWAIAPRLTLVDRRYFGSPAASFSTAEAGAIVSWTPREPLRLSAGLSGQANQAGGLGAATPWGGQLRSLARLGLSGERWRISAEYRFTAAFEGETEEEAPPVFTALGDYAEDVDALSGGGFTQHRLGLSGAVERGAWTLSASGLARLRAAEAEEDAAVYGRSFGGQARAERGLAGGLSGFATAGVNAAAAAQGRGYTDLWGWAGLTWRGAHVGD